MIDSGNDDNLSDEELLNIPADRLPTLSRLWAVRSGAVYFKQMMELAAEKSGNARNTMLFHDRDPRAQRREEEERRRTLRSYQLAMQEIRDHADRLLLRIDEQQLELEKRRNELEGRALHLHDGRRFWVDGDRYRDDNGVLLQGRDHGEAKQLARDRPDAPTWAEHENIRANLAEIQRIKVKVLAERDGQGDPAETEKHLSQYEKELHDRVEKQGASLTAAPVAYGDANYDDLLSAQPTFNSAASIDNTPAATADRKDSETASVDYKKLSRPPGQGGPKFS